MKGSNAVRTGRGKCSHGIPLKEHCVKCAELFTAGPLWSRISQDRDAEETREAK